MLEVIKPGPLSTIQDIGRQGLRHLGVSQAGVIDLLRLNLQIHSCQMTTIMQLLK